MKNYVVLGALVMGSLFVFSGCSKYEEGPWLSVIPAEDRIAGIWEVAIVYDEDGDNVTDNWDGYTWDFQEDGTTMMTVEGPGFSITYDGEWTLVDDKETVRYELNGFTAGLPWGSEELLEILRLKQDEFWFRDEKGREFQLTLK
jgi:hypothetical protein